MRDGGRQGQRIRGNQEEKGAGYGMEKEEESLKEMGRGGKDGR